MSDKPVGNSQVEEVHEHGSRMRKLVTSITTKFVHLASDQIDSGIQDALRLLGEMEEVDRTYVFLLSPDGKTASNTHEWCAPGIQSRMGRLRGISSDSLPWMRDRLARYEAAQVWDRSQLPKEAIAERELMDRQGILSAVVVPLTYGRTLRGFMGFDAIRKACRWSREAVDLLEVVGEVFINALERKRSEEILRTSEERYRTVFETHPSPLLVYDIETRRFLAINETAIRHYGYSRDEFLERTIEKIHPPDELPRLHDHFSKLDSDVPNSGIWRHQTKNGKILESEVNAYPFELDGRRARLVIAEDVTERQRTMQALRDSELRHRILIETSPDLVGVVSDGRFVFMNPAGVSILGATNLDSVVGRNARDLVHPSYRDALLQELLKVAEEGVSRRFEEEKLVRLDGRVIEAEMSASPFLWEGKSAVLLIARENSERKTVEREIKKTLSLLQATLEATNDGILVVDLNRRIVSFNERFLRIWDLKSQEVEGKTGEELFLLSKDRLAKPEEFGPKVEALYRDPEAESFDLLEFADGRMVERYSAPQYLDGVPVGRVWSYRDVTERNDAERALRESERRYRALFERNLAGVYRNTVDGRVIDCNDACARIFGYSTRAEFLEKSAIDVYYDPDERLALLRNLRQKGSMKNVEVCLKRKDGSPVWVLETISLVKSEDGETEILEGTLIDISDRKQAEAALTESEERYRMMSQYSTDLMSRHTQDGIYLYASPACRNLLGYDPSELLGKPVSDYFHPEDAPLLRQGFKRHLRDGEDTFTLRYRMRRKDGEYCWFETISRPLKSPLSDAIVEIIAVSRDITERKLAEEKIQYQAYHDGLTGLPNRMLFKDRIEVALGRAERTKTMLGVVFLDLDHFKIINDTFGHAGGDRLLQQVAIRLQETLRKGDTVSRMGGDEFTILVVELGHERNVTSIAEKVLSSFTNPFEIDEREVRVTPSIGIALYPQDGLDAETLLKNADSAMYRAKELGRANYQLCTPAMNARATERLEIQRSLRDALDRNEFVVHYQPVFDCGTGGVCGTEALVRWCHPVSGMKYPSEFLGIVEEARMIIRLGEWVLHEACRQTQEWNAKLGCDLYVAVNLSAPEFQNRDLVHSVEKVLHETGLPPRLLRLEITEATAMQDGEWTIAMLRQLGALGVRIAIDDFGAGQWSLNYLKMLSLAVVKIDREFVQGVPDDEKDVAIVRALTTMGRGLGLEVVAEGVETERQRTFLSEIGCDAFQGFLFARPLPADEVADVVRGAVGMEDAG